MLFIFRKWNKIVAGFNASSNRPQPSDLKQLQKLATKIRCEAKKTADYETTARSHENAFKRDCLNTGGGIVKATPKGNTHIHIYSRLSIRLP